MMAFISIYSGAVVMTAFATASLYIGCAHPSADVKIAGWIAFAGTCFGAMCLFIYGASFH